ncbi:hypothetical protein PMAYCL1PPCAC_19428, partial [Pristionchus mayeri]
GGGVVVGIIDALAQTILAPLPSSFVGPSGFIFTFHLPSLLHFSSVTLFQSVPSRWYRVNSVVLHFTSGSLSPLFSASTYVFGIISSHFTLSGQVRSSGAVSVQG